MIRIDIENRTYHVPSEMNEMTEKQLIFLSKLVAEEVPIQEIKVKMLLFCLNARLKTMKLKEYHRIKIDNDTFALTTEDIVKGSTAFDYLFTAPDENGNCFLDIRLTIPTYPTVEIGDTILYAPGEALTDAVYDQFIHLASYDAMKEENPESIFDFLGCMYQKDVDVFDAKDLHIKKMKKFTPEQILLINWYWIGSCRFAFEKFVHIPTGGDGDTGGNPYDAQMKLLNSIAQGDPAKTKQYKQDKFYNILYSLDHIMEVQEKQPQT